MFGRTKISRATRKWLIDLVKNSLKIGLLGLLFCAFYVAVYSGRPSPVPVSGTVTYNGVPLVNVNVICIGKGSATATGTTDSQGRFAQLTTNRPGDGAFPGDYSVGIAPVTPTPEANAPASYDTPPPPPFPVRYLSADTSHLTISVKPTGQNNFHLELKD